MAVIVLLGVILGFVALGLIIAFVLVPLLQGVIWLVVSFFKLIGGLVMHVFGFVHGMIRDVFRGIGAIPAGLVFAVLSVLNVIIGRWSAAAHFASNMKNEVGNFGACVYRVAIGHPFRLLGLGSLLEGIEERVPAALADAPGPDRPSRRSGVFDGYTIVGSLPGGGSGGKLYIAEPSDEKRRFINRSGAVCPDRVVIKSFAVADGSSLPQIVRESRSLEGAKKIGLVLEHELTDDRFFYVMPYVPGENLGAIVRQAHSRAKGDGLDERKLRNMLSYASDVLRTLDQYHAAGLWHKDIKPENIIVANDEAHIVDLGLVTPLRSAMTLTTHGTEYFRDPEMVRLALRGVKVHEVDGVKFDLYAVGAVLYYMLENTFPSHGGLSSITKQCPESLKWVVRRAMTDYQQRYGSAAIMLRDLEAIRRHPSPYSMKPAELPSMRGEAAVEFDAREHAEVAAFAGSPMPPRDSVGASTRPRGSRPSIEVVNWWTGGFRKSDEHADGIHDRVFPKTSSRVKSAGANLKSAVAEAVDGVRRQVDEWSNHGEGRVFVAGIGIGGGKSRKKNGRKSAAEQVRSARARAEATRKRVRSRRGVASRRPMKSPAERMPWGPIVATGVVALVAVGVISSIDESNQQRARSAVARATGAAPAPPAAISTDLLSSVVSLPKGLLVIKEHPDSLNETASLAAQGAERQLALLGFQPLNNTDLEARVRTLVSQEFAGSVNLSDRERIDATEGVVGAQLGQGDLSNIGCVLWLNWDPGRPDVVRPWVLTPGCLQSEVDDEILTYLLSH
ncbi:MAG: hypothetical protein ACF8PN_13675 [Phycisphaerales bacterium]